MKVLITGASGLVGRNILDRYPRELSYELVTPTSRELDLLNYAAALKFIKNENPDAVIHAAGVVGGIQANINYPARFLVDNTQIGTNITLAAYEGGVKQFLNLGSSCMYPSNANNPLKEDSILSGILEPTNEGYALAKIYTQRLGSYLNREIGERRFKTIIPCNLYGKWDKFSTEWGHMIPAVIQKIHQAYKNQLKTVEIWGDGNARREFMFASDLADFIWFTLSHFETLPELMNVGLGYDYSINEYYQTIAKVIGFKGEFVHNLDKPVGMKQKLVDITQQTRLGWIPQTSLVDGIKQTYQFYLEAV